MNWSIVSMDKRSGSLDIRNLFTLNSALLGKWLWRFVIEWYPLWKQVIVGK